MATKVATRAIVMQHKTQRPVQSEITQATRDALQARIKQDGLTPEELVAPHLRHLRLRHPGDRCGRPCWTSSRAWPPS
jgi:hypothetical protein